MTNIFVLQQHLCAASQRHVNLQAIFISNENKMFKLFKIYEYITHTGLINFGGLLETA